MADFIFLGLIIFSDLKRHKHKHITLKIFKVIEIMYSIKSILQSNMLCTIHNALIMPHFNDSHLAWGSNTKTGLGWICYINRPEQVLIAAITLPILNQSVKKNTSCKTY